MLLHAAVHWPEAADPKLWPLAVRHVVYLHNLLPNAETGFSPSDLFTRTKHPTKHLLNLHPLFCPAYALDKTIADGHKLPRWKPRSDRYVFVGFSEKHASTVPLLLNPRTGSIVTNYHVVFDDWFSTVSSSIDMLPDVGSDHWNKLFGDSEFQYVLEEQDTQLLPMEPPDDVIAAKHATRSATVAAAMYFKSPPRYLPTPLPSPVSSPSVLSVHPSAAEGSVPIQQRESSTQSP
jgi:hypothetical protein